MKIALDSSVRLDAMITLYEQLQKVRPGSLRGEQLEHALTLALRADLGADTPREFYKSVLHNAKRDLWRSRQRRRQATSLLTANPQVTIHVDQEDTTLWEDVLRREVVPLGTSACQILEGLMAEQSLQNIANQLGVSVRTVHRVREKIRCKLSNFFEATA